MIYLTSDFHIGHRKILEFEPGRLKWCQDLFDMNEILLNDILSLEADDELYILGDFLFQKHILYDKVEEILKARRCKLHLILGNHDEDLNPKWLSNVFDSYGFYDKITDSGRTFILSHYPMVNWDGCGRKDNPTIMCHGHLHSRKTDYQHPRLFNVGVDSPHYSGRMITTADIIKITDQKQYSKDLLDVVSDKNFTIKAFEDIIIEVSKSGLGSFED
jgi:calcineurin-like phosphoesterase family protein